MWYKFITRLSFVDYVSIMFIFIIIWLSSYFIDWPSLLNLPSLLEVLLIINLMQLYFDDFKLSKTKIVKYMQVFSFTVIPLYTIYYIYITPIGIEIVLSVLKSKSIYITLCMGVPAMVMAKHLVESSISPWKKVGLLLGASMLGGFMFILFPSIG